MGGCAFPANLSLALLAALKALEGVGEFVKISRRLFESAGSSDTDD